MATTDEPDTTTIEVTRKQARTEKAAVELARTVFLAMNRRSAPATVAVKARKDSWEITFTEECPPPQISISAPITAVRSGGRWNTSVREAALFAIRTNSILRHRDIADVPVGCRVRTDRK